MVFGYSASKAATRSWILSAREQLKAAGGHKINLIELYTPIVQSKWSHFMTMSHWGKY
jgi:short-subunit dehydrogenase involved in D-alanine esterification of teichoic acids